jgi:hypothetical protein
MKLLTVQIETTEEKAEAGFQELVEALAENLISADRETLTIRVEEFPGLGGEA